MKINIKTKDFILRNYRLSDVDDLTRNINDGTVAKFMSRIPYPYTKKDARIFIKKAINEDNKQSPRGVRIAIEVKGELVGGIGATFRGHIVTIGYWITKKYRGIGLSRRAVREVVKFLFKQNNIKRIEAFTFLKNIKSQRLLLALGFKNEGLLRKYIMKKRKYLDCYIFGKVK